uniref:Uncharacterized protein n=1 Tax=Rhizophora mucronata TaxID=61149 RepID=A0A2P2QZR6_RHIMU
MPTLVWHTSSLPRNVAAAVH